MQKFMVLKINYGEGCKFKTAKELLDFFGEDWRAASHEDVFEERDELVAKVRRFENKFKERDWGSRKESRKNRKLEELKKKEEEFIKDWEETYQDYEEEK